MGNLTLVSWETSLALVCGQLFAPQSNVPSELHERSCTRDDQIDQESRLQLKLSCNVKLVFINLCWKCFACAFPRGCQKSGSATKQQTVELKKIWYVVQGHFGIGLKPVSTVKKHGFCLAEARCYHTCQCIIHIRSSSHQQ